jgi:hypothetical protein
MAKNAELAGVPNEVLIKKKYVFRSQKVMLYIDLA